MRVPFSPQSTHANVPPGVRSECKSPDRGPHRSLSPLELADGVRLSFVERRPDKRVLGGDGHAPSGVLRAHVRGAPETLAGMRAELQIGERIIGAVVSAALSPAVGLETALDFPVGNQASHSMLHAENVTVRLVTSSQVLEISLPTALRAVLSAQLEDYRAFLPIHHTRRIASAAAPRRGIVIRLLTGIRKSRTVAHGQRVAELQFG